MPQGVGVLKQQRAVLLKRVAVRQEHGLGAHNLLVDARQELLHPLALLRWQGVEAGAEGLHGTRTLRQLGCQLLLHLRQGHALTLTLTLTLLLLQLLQLGAEGADGAPQSNEVPLHPPCDGAGDEGHQGLEAGHTQQDLGEVGRKLVRAQDVVVVLCPLVAVGHPQHVHGLGGLPHRGVGVGGGDGEEALVHTVHQLGQVEGTQDVLAQDVVVHHQGERLLGAGGGVVVVHGGGGHLHKVRPRQRRHQADAVAVHTAAHRHNDRRQLLGLGLGHMVEQLRRAVVVVPLVRLPRLVGVVEAPRLLQRLQQVPPIPQRIARLSARHNGVVALRVVRAQCAPQPVQGLVVGAVVGHHG